LDWFKQRHPKRLKQGVIMLEHNQQNNLDSVIDRVGPPQWRLWDRRALIVLALIILWTLFARIDRVVTAPAKVIPIDKVKVIQHLEGGIVKSLVVKEGQQVKAGDALVVLDLATVGVNGMELSTRMAAMNLTKARLKAESSGAEFTVPSKIDKKLQASANAERNTFLARRSEHQSTLAALEGQLTQARQRVGELRARLNSSQQSLRLAQQELAISEKLIADRLVSEIEHSQRKGSVERLKGDVAAAEQSIPGALAQVDEMLARKAEETGKYRRRASDELVELERNAATLGEQVTRADDQEGRSVIRAPIDGYVKNLKYVAMGNVVKAGEPIMEIVPTKDQLVLEVKLMPADRGYVKLGQEAIVKISAYDFYRYGGLEGKVQAIAADTDEGRNQEQYFRVIVETKQAYFGDYSQGMLITPGMNGEVDIKVETQSLLWALLRPIFRLKAEAFKEV
jgi:membrane fusion protein, adhesin transport system